MKSKKLFIIAGIIIVLIVIIGIVAISIFTNNKIPELYQQKIDEYAEAMSVGEEEFYENYYENNSSINCSEGVSAYYSYGSSIRYTLNDIDKNGVDELIFSIKSESEENLVDIYTIKEGELLKLFSDTTFGYRSLLYVLDDGTLLTYSDGGINHASCALYTLREFANYLTPEILEAYYYDENNGSSVPYHKKVSKNEFSKFFDEHYSRSIVDKLNWTEIKPSDKISDKSDIKKNEFQEISDYDKLINTIQGYWATPTDYGYYDCVCFEENQVSYGSTAPHGGIRPSEITDVTKNTDGTFKVLVFYPEIEMYDELEPAMEEYKIFSSNDNFTDSLIIKSDGRTTEYFYAGETYEEFEKKCDIEFILNRELFIFKNDFPFFYEASINMENTKAYKNNWTIRQVINEENFSNIQWTSTEYNSSVNIVTFSGRAKIGAADVTIEFYVQDGAKVPLAWSMDTNSKTSATINIQKFIDLGMDFDFALMSSDASIVTMMVLLSEDAIQTTSESYEKPNHSYKTNKQKNISVGMTKRQVESAWGTPQDIDKVTDSYGTQETWYYGNGKMVVFGNNEKVQTFFE